MTNIDQNKVVAFIIFEFLQKYIDKLKWYFFKIIGVFFPGKILNNLTTDELNPLWASFVNVDKDIETLEDSGVIKKLVNKGILRNTNVQKDLEYTNNIAFNYEIQKWAKKYLEKNKNKIFKNFIDTKDQKK